jgi:hypothetical protein
MTTCTYLCHCVLLTCNVFFRTLSVFTSTGLQVLVLPLKHQPSTHMLRLRLWQDAFSPKRQAANVEKVPYCLFRLSADHCRLRACPTQFWAITVICQPLCVHSDITDNNLAVNRRSPAAHPQPRLSGGVSNLTVAQGQDTDCYGELIGSILGAYFGPGYLEERWLAPFNQGCLASTRTGWVASTSGRCPRWHGEWENCPSRLRRRQECRPLDGLKRM